MYIINIYNNAFNFHNQISNINSSFGMKNSIISIYKYNLEKH